MHPAAKLRLAAGVSVRRLPRPGCRARHPKLRGDPEKSKPAPFAKSAKDAAPGRRFEHSRPEGFIYRPSFSPDGKKVAFDSDRLGYEDIWVCDSDGTNCGQVTNLHAIRDTVRWSPDGRSLSFESSYKHFWQLYVSEVPGGQPRLINTNLTGYNGCPNWSRDGQWIYICVDQSSVIELWKVPLKGGTPVQVTTHEGIYGIESDDGRWLYYEGKRDARGIWKIPLSSGDEILVLDRPLEWFDWVLTHTGIYYINQDFKPNGRIEFLDFASHEITPIFSLERPKAEFGGLAISPDAKALYWGQTDRDESYIMFIKNFR